MHSWETNVGDNGSTSYNLPFLNRDILQNPNLFQLPTVLQHPKRVPFPNQGFRLFLLIPPMFSTPSQASQGPHAACGDTATRYIPRDAPKSLHTTSTEYSTLLVLNWEREAPASPVPTKELLLG